MSTNSKNAHALHKGPESDVKHLPSHVESLISAQEAESERLIGWVQLALVVILAALFSFAPRPNDAPMIMLLEPVPLALLSYGVFTITRLAIAHMRRLPKWMVVVSILVDTCLLLALIWTFHWQYGQSAAFSLKVPTFIYFFVFIALRALRFDYRLVLASGFVAAGGWIILVLAVLRNEREGVITRSFSDYMNGSRVLLGAEIEKILLILLVAVLLAIAVKRARDILLSAVREQIEGHEIRRFLPVGVADAIVRSDRALEAGDAQERLAAIIMLDIRGFTAFSKQVKPRAVVQMLISLHARLIPIIEAKGGIIDKFLGDGLMVTFGAVTPSKTAAAEAMHALDAVMIEAEDWRVSLNARDEKYDLQVNGAMAVGNVVFATLGNADRLEYTVIGEAVNLAAKLEKHNKQLGSAALFSQACFKIALNQGYRRKVENSGAGRPQRLHSEIRTFREQSVAGVSETIDLMAIYRR